MMIRKGYTNKKETTEDSICFTDHGDVCFYGNQLRLYTLPLLIVFLCASKYFMDGLTAGAVKE